MTSTKIYENGVNMNIYVQSEARDYLEERAKREERSMSFIVNRILMNLRQKDLGNKANGTGTTSAIGKIGTECEQNIKEVVKNE
jgi:hypothetical protein